MITEVILISIGPASLPETWSGVPFFLLRELTRRGIVVHNIDLEPHRYIKIIYNRVILPIVSLFVTKGDLSIYRSIFFRLYQYVKLFNISRKYANADLILGISLFNLTVPKKSKPLILFSDWPFSYDLLKRNIEIGKYQKFHIQYEDYCMNRADLLISLFPTCAKYINAHLKIDKAISLGINVVNNLSSPSSNDVTNKIKKCKLVFIGRNHYISGAFDLLNRYNELSKIIPNIELDIIGLHAKDFPVSILKDLKGVVRFWGYLDKGNDEHCKIYYNILRNASIYVNTTPGWVGYTSMIEAMYFYTPVIVYPCPEFIDEFGEQIDFGAYIDNSQNLVKEISNIWYHKDFQSMTMNAHRRVSNYTWSHFIDEFLRIVSLKID